VLAQALRWDGGRGGKFVLAEVRSDRDRPLPFADDGTNDATRSV
jgi:hypothetical protein